MDALIIVAVVLVVAGLLVSVILWLRNPGPADTEYVTVAELQARLEHEHDEPAEAADSPDRTDGDIEPTTTAPAADAPESGTAPETTPPPAAPATSAAEGTSGVSPTVGSGTAPGSTSTTGGAEPPEATDTDKVARAEPETAPAAGPEAGTTAETGTDGDTESTAETTPAGEPSGKADQAEPAPDQDVAEPAPDAPYPGTKKSTDDQPS